MRIPISQRVRDVVGAFKEGRISRRQLAVAIGKTSTSIRFASLLPSLGRCFDCEDLRCNSARLCPDLLTATQSRLEQEKHVLVRLLFDRLSTFEQYQVDFFGDFPVAVLHLPKARYAILDGHHRVRRYCELCENDRERQGGLQVKVIGTRCRNLLTRYQELVRQVETVAGNAHIESLPIE